MFASFVVDIPFQCVILFFQFFNVLFIEGGTKRIVQTTRSLSLDNRNRKGVLHPMSFVLLL